MRSTVALLAALLAAPLALAQETPPGDRATPLEEGAHALLFQIGPDLDLRGLDGATLSYKRHRSEERAVRIGVTAQAEALVALDDDVDREVLGLSATALRLRYRRSRTPVYLYTGFGPTARLSATRAAGPGGDATSAVEIGAGLAGVVGVEWIVAEAIGVTGEFGQSLVVSGQFGGADVVRLSFQPHGVRLGVAVYF